jgi:hypothetical protein
MLSHNSLSVATLVQHFRNEKVWLSSISHKLIRDSRLTKKAQHPSLSTYSSYALTILIQVIANYHWAEKYDQPSIDGDAQKNFRYRDRHNTKRHNEQIQ